MPAIRVLLTIFALAVSGASAASTTDCLKYVDRWHKEEKANLDAREEAANRRMRAATSAQSKTKNQAEIDHYSDVISSVVQEWIQLRSENETLEMRYGQKLRVCASGK